MIPPSKTYTCLIYTTSYTLWITLYSFYLFKLLKSWKISQCLILHSHLPTILYFCPYHVVFHSPKRAPVCFCMYCFASVHKNNSFFQHPIDIILRTGRPISLPANAWIIKIRDPCGDKHFLLKITHLVNRLLFFSSNGNCF